MQYLKQSTAATLKIGPFIDDTDGKTAETGLTIAQSDVRLSKNGGDIAQKTEATSCTHDELGIYGCPIDATDTATLGRLQLWVHESGALPVWHEFLVIPANVYDSLFSTDKLQVDVTQLLGTAWLTPGVAGTPDVNAKLLGSTAQTGNDVGADVNSILVDTAEIGTAGAGLTDLGGMATGMKAEIESECNDALVALKLDHLIAVADADDVVDSSIIAKLASKGATPDWSTFVNTTDALEAIRDRGDAAWVTGAGGSDRLLMVDTTIATLASQTSFTLTSGSADDDAYNNATIVIEDASTATQKAIGLISNYVGATKTVTLKYDPGIFTMAATDKVYILANNALKATLANRQLNVAADGDVAGNVDGAVASVTADVGITQAGADKVRASVCVTGDPVNSIGKVLYEIYINRLTSARAGYLANINNANLATIADISTLTSTEIAYLNASISSRSSHTAANVWAVGTRALTDKAGFALSAAGITSIWEKNISAFSGAGYAGTYLKTVYDDWLNAGRLDLILDAILVDTGTTLENHLTAVEGATFDTATDSLEAIRNRGDAAWITGGGGGITDILQVVPSIPTNIDLADTKTVRIALYLLNSLDDLPSTAEIVPGTTTIERSADGGTSWSVIVNAAACTEQAGQIYYDEVFDSGTGYASGDMIRITFKSQKITVAANDYEITDATYGWMFHTRIDGGAGASAASIADAVWDELSTGHTGAGKAGQQLWTDVDAILTDTGTTLDALIKRVLGLTQENHYIDNTTFTTGKLTAARIRIYSVAGSVSTASDVIATYNIVITYDANGNMETYKVTKA